MTLRPLHTALPPAAELQSLTGSQSAAVQRPAAEPQPAAIQRAAADSLAAADLPAADSLAAGERAPLPALFGPEGNLFGSGFVAELSEGAGPSVGALPAAAEEPFYREATPSEVFGARSVQAALPFGRGGAPDPLAAPAYGGAALLLLLLYATLLCRHLDDVGRLLGRLQRDRSAEKRLYEDSGSGHARFLTISCTLGLFAAGLAVVRFAAPLIPAPFAAELPRTGALLLSLGVMAALALTLLYQRGVTFGVAALTYSRPLIERLWIVKRHAAALLTVAVTPPLLLLLLLPAGTGKFWLWLIITELFVSAFLYLRETLALFHAKKISILHWFLYLCTVEFFPLSLCLLLVGRYAI